MSLLYFEAWQSPPSSVVLLLLLLMMMLMMIYFWLHCKGTYMQRLKIMPQHYK